MRTCPKCEASKPSSAFAKNSLTSHGLQVYCRDCRATDYRTTFKSRQKYNKRHGIELHGISKQEYDKQTKKQKGRCLLCKRKVKRKMGGMSLDHAHNCSKIKKHKHLCGKTLYGCRYCIRGLLCCTCNRYVVPFLERELPNYPYLKNRPFLGAT